MGGDAKYAYFETEALASPIAATRANAVSKPLMLRLPQPDTWATRWSHNSNLVTVSRARMSEGGLKMDVSVDKGGRVKRSTRTNRNEERHAH